MNRADPAPVYWITGLSGAGKTTVASLLCERMRDAGIHPVLLDGDVLRRVFGGAHGHDRKDRLQLASSYAHLCKELSEQGVVVVCATISLFREVHDWSRQNISQYREIFLMVPKEELQRRDSKEIYSRFNQGEITQVAGLDLAIDEPANPDLVIENFNQTSAKMAVTKIWETFGLGEVK